MADLQIQQRDIFTHPVEQDRGVFRDQEIEVLHSGGECCRISETHEKSNTDRRDT